MEHDLRCRSDGEKKLTCSVRPAATPAGLVGGWKPLLRLIVAWLPAGAIAALALSASSRSSAVRRAVVVALVAWPILVLADAASDAAAVSAGIFSHLPEQLTRAGTWAALVLVAVGAALMRPRSAR